MGVDIVVVERVETREDPSIASAPIEIAVAEHVLALRRWRMEDAANGGRRRAARRHRGQPARAPSLDAVGERAGQPRFGAGVPGGRGYATAAARALTEVGFACFPDVDRMEIRCHPDNAASAAIPPKLGYSLDTDRSGTQLVWVRFRS